MIINTSVKVRSFLSPCSLSRRLGPLPKASHKRRQELPTPSGCCQSPVKLTVSLRPCPPSLGGGPKAGLSGRHCFHQPLSSDSCVQEQDWAPRTSRPAWLPVSGGNVGQKSHPTRQIFLHSRGKEVGPCAQELA